MVMIPPAITHGNDGQYQIIKRKDCNFIQSRLATTRLLRMRFDSNSWRRREKKRTSNERTYANNNKIIGMAVMATTTR
jgi:hypothetical protein